ncbi:MAG: D-tyrosyl-tRNA(Tyr) deacylase [Bacteroidetes bacterium]|jgi:D-aminoacyl-tRNA deacylase|nr:D-tyrosyl-tRNA(Tyr) deacylase [Bacteroidota bacterium]MBT5528374.1 D-tyrosyl-tRNA(Tyr) deacylase [Cytophagia bacterium]MBT3424141.1 D-tyrosyl-tRNA(Tyr) deacylase [Bacteroidota bacterium]MBT5991602.1 D-tyrosyl-tRNA(Tyr) deacylase [Bacteroidota bacterium]MBT6685241.1 D-tyrosyl-tRNA(Tyr) deacylase [Bacteroidota bacterium]
MRVVIQRVKKATVIIDNKLFSEISQGLLILLGIEEKDGSEDIEWLCKKISLLRVFDDEFGTMNLSVQDIKGDLMVVSQFTLHASTKKGNRPSYIKAADPLISIPLYEQFVESLEQASGIKVKTGKFGAIMNVALFNDGPVTLIIDSKNKE